MSTQSTFLLIRSSIDPTFCGIFVCGPLQFKCQKIELAQSAAQAEDGKPVVTVLAKQDDFQPRIV